jgi:hypothetical protein
MFRILFEIPFPLLNKTCWYHSMILHERLLHGVKTNGGQKKTQETQQHWI